MQIPIDSTKWYERLWAAFIFFTRLPFWRLYQPRKEAYSTVVEHWPLTGWLTGGVMAGVLWATSLVFPYEIAVITAVAVRLMMTGALHEDGLADFMDGFGGGGSDRQRILDIMKDSHIGTYGVLGLIVYMLLLFFALYAMNPVDAALSVAFADPYAKMLTAQLVQMMPYARNEETAKNRTVYRKFSAMAGVSLAIQGLLPMGVFIYMMYVRVNWQLLVFIPALVMYLLYLLVWRRLRGYTGDCCGAICLIVELATLLTACYYLQA